MLYIHTVKFYVATKNNKTKLFIDICTQAEIIILEDVLESERQRYCFLSFVDLKFNINS